MQLTYEQVEFIRKQYLNFLKGKLSIDKLNTKIQKHFKVNIDFTETIQYCKKYNKGCSDITWRFLEV